MSKVYTGVVAGLVILAAVLGVAIYKQSGENSNPAGQNSTNSDLEQGRPQETGEVSREDVLKVPGPDASEEELRQHFELASRLAQESDKVVLRGCSPEPLVLAVPVDSDFVIENPDSVEHVIGFDLKTTYTIPAGGEITITADFPNGPGLYGYGCDADPGVSGFFILFDPGEKLDENTYSF